MKRICAVALLLLITLTAILTVAQNTSVLPQTGFQNDEELRQIIKKAKAVPPIRIFDNLYYVGIDWVSAYVLKTSDGLILIDTLYGEFTKHIMRSMRELGLNPRDIKYVIVTHGHFDHVAGAKAVQTISGARVGMADADWTLLEQDAKAKRLNFELPRRDLVIRDGDKLTLGDTTLKFYITPGHTPGVVSMEFPVRDGEQTYKALMFGGVGLNFSGVERTQSYLNSVRRLMKLSGVQVNITNHPGPARVFERAELLAARKPGDPHPFVAPDEFTAWLRSLMVNAEKKLEQEKQAARAEVKP